MMSKTEAEAYSLTYAELAILANYVGSNQIYGFSLDEIQDLKKTDLIQILHNMVKNKILSVEGERFEISEFYKKLIMQIVKAKQCIIIRPKSDELPEKCCYLGEDLLVTEVSKFKEGSIRLEYKKKEDIFHFLEEGGYLPDTMSEEHLEVNIQEAVEMSKEILDMSAEEVFTLPEVTLVIEIVNLKKMDEIRWISIFEEALDYRLVIKKDTSIEQKTYSKENLVEQIGSMIGEE